MISLQLAIKPGSVVVESGTKGFEFKCGVMVEFIVISKFKTEDFFFLFFRKGLEVGPCRIV